MAVEIRVPAFGESVVEATVGRFLKKVGDTIKLDEDLVELETDKANVPIPSPYAGILLSIETKEGDIVSVNDLIATIGDSGDAHTTASTATLEKTPTENATPADAKTEPDASTPDYSAKTKPVSSESAASVVADIGSKLGVTPVAERVAAANNVNLSEIKGTGAGGKIMKDDVEAHVKSGVSSPSVSSAITPAKPQVESVSTPIAPKATSTVAPAVQGSTLSAANDSRVERRPMTRRRQVIAANLKNAQNTAAMLTTFNDVDMTAIMDLRKRRNEAFEKRNGVKLGFMSFFTKAVVGALKAFPLLNAEIDGTDLLIKHYYDIGIAVGAVEGLVVPIIREADGKTFAGIEKEIGVLAGRARENKLSLSEMMGGTFTITNGGIFGSMMSTPILNYPQVGILGMHSIIQRPVAINNEVVIRPMMYLALSYDHRIVDGSEAVRFLVRVKEMVEDPETLLVEG